MSNILTSLCRPLRISPTQKAVLMCRADFAHDDGLDWHSIPSVCEWTCLGRTAVIEAHRSLEAAGLLTLDKSSGRSNRCMLNVDAIRSMQPNQSAMRTSPPAGPVRHADDTSPPAELPPVRETDQGSPPGGPEASISISKASEKHRDEPNSRKSPRAKKVKNMAVIPDDCLPDWLPVQLWNSYRRMRVSIKSEMTVDAQKLLIGKIAKLRDGGHEPATLLEAATIGNWKSVYPEKNSGGERGSASPLHANDVFAGAR